MGLGAGLWLGLVASLIAPAGAQQLAPHFSGFASNPDAPIEIEADRLDVDDVKKTAVFSGRVKAVQGDFVLRTERLIVRYSGAAGGAGPGPGAGPEIRELEARNRVFITSKNNQSATSNWAKFDVKSQIVTIGGNVVLTQGKNVIKGERLVINLVTGKSRFETPGGAGTTARGGKRGRVRMLIKRAQRARPQAKQVKKQPTERQNARAAQTGRAPTGASAPAAWPRADQR